MPIVPRNVQPIADRTEFQQQRAYYAPGAFGRGEGNAIAGIGQSLDKTANALNEIILEEQFKDNKRQAKELDVEFSRQQRELLYGENGFYNLQGNNAVNAVDGVKQSLEKIRNDVLNKASNGAVKDMFDFSSASRVQAELESIDRFTSKERKVANNLASQARVKEAVEDASAAWNNPEVAARSESIIKNEIIDQGEEQGWSPEVVQSQIEDAISEIYFGKIETALDTGHVKEAKSLLSQYGDKLEPKQSAKVQKELISEARSQEAEYRAQVHFQWAKEDRARALKDRADKEYIDIESQRSVDAMIAAGLDEEQMRASLEGAVDPDLREAVERRIDLMAARRDRDYSRAAKETSRSLNEQVAQGKSFNQALSELSDPQKALVYENPSMFETAQRIEREVAEDQLYSNVDDGTTFAKLYALPAQKLAQEDLLTYRSKLTEGQYNKLLSAQRYAVQHTTETTDLAASVLNNAERDLRQDLAGNKLYFEKPGKPTDALNTAINDLRSWVYEYVDRTGKSPTDKEVKQQAAVLTSTFSNSTWFGLGSEQLLLRNMTPEQKEKATLPYDRITQYELERLNLYLLDKNIDLSQIDQSDYEELAAAMKLGQIQRLADIRNRLIEEQSK